MNVEFFNQLSSPWFTIKVFVLLSLVILSTIFAIFQLVQIIRLKSRGAQVGWRKSIEVTIAFILCCGTVLLLHSVNLYSVYVANDLRDTYAAMGAYVDYRDNGCDECKAQLIEAANNGHLISAALAGKGGFYSEEAYNSVLIEFSNRTYVDRVLSNSFSYYHSEPLEYSLFYSTLKRVAPIVDQINELAPSVVGNDNTRLSTDGS